MRILVIGLNYAPDEIGIAKYTTELCVNLASRGHVVRAVTGPPYYPEWKVRKVFKGRAWSKALEGGVIVYRTPLYVPRHPSGFSRIIHLFSFAAASLPLCLYLATKWKPELVFAVAPAITSAPVAVICARLSGASAWLHVQDFEIDVAFDLIKIKGRKRRSIALGVEAFVLRSFDWVSTISPNMLKALVIKGVPDARAIELRNWVNPEIFNPTATGMATMRQSLSLGSDQVIALYSGSMGSKQGLEILDEVARRLENLAPNVVLLLCGEGPIRAKLERQTRGRNNIVFIGLRPVEQLADLLGSADIHILPQRAEASDLVLPSKLSGMLASGRPVIAMAAEGTGLALEVGAAGLLVKAGDAAAMANAIAILAGDVELRVKMGAVARDLAHHRWDRASIIDTFEEHVISHLKPKVVSPAQLGA